MSEGVAHRFTERPRSERGEKSQMPDFDTRRPQEPDRPNRMHLFVAASRQHMFGVASKLRTPVRALLRNRKMRRLGLALSVLSLVVLAGVLTAWAVETHSEQVDQKLDWAVETPREQLDQKIQPQEAPEYHQRLEPSRNCALWPINPWLYDDECYKVVLNTSHFYSYIMMTPGETTKLALITEDFVETLFYIEPPTVLRLDFYRNPHSQQQMATSYCFGSRDDAVSALRHVLRDAELVGKTDFCYVAIYRGVGPDLKSW
jgi:hypothetical protein